MLGDGGGLGVLGDGGGPAENCCRLAEGISSTKQDTSRIKRKNILTVNISY